MAENGPSKDAPGKEMFGSLDGAFWFLVVLAFGSVGAAIWLKGWGVLQEGGELILNDLKIIVPQVALGVLVGALFNILVPRQLVAKNLGEGSGMRGIVIATVFGAVMPGGPFTSFPLLIALGKAGAGIGQILAFMVSWSACGLSRAVVWELPFMGADFAVLRFLSSLPLPILAGLLATFIVRRFPRMRPEFEE